MANLKTNLHHCEKCLTIRRCMHLKEAKDADCCELLWQGGRDGVKAGKRLPDRWGGSGPGSHQGVQLAKPKVFCSYISYCGGLWRIIITIVLRYDSYLSIYKNEKKNLRNHSALSYWMLHWFVSSMYRFPRTCCVLFCFWQLTKTAQ